MKRMKRWGTAVAVGLPLLVLAAGPADAKPAYAKTEQKSCSFCHVGKNSDKVFTEAGKQYAAHHTLKGIGEEAKAPKPAAEAAAGTVAKPSAEETPDPAVQSADPQTTEQGSPCDCGGTHCTEKPCGHHGHKHGGGMMPPRMEKMKGHLEEMQKAVTGLRESEKKLEASAGSDPFRAAVLDHLKKLDDLQASHLSHMEGMMGRMHHGKEGNHCGKDCPHGCQEKRGCDCPCGGMKQ